MRRGLAQEQSTDYLAPQQLFLPHVVVVVVHGSS